MDSHQKPWQLLGKSSFSQKNTNRTKIVEFLIISQAKDITIGNPINSNSISFLNRFKFVFKFVGLIGINKKTIKIPKIPVLDGCDYNEA